MLKRLAFALGILLTVAGVWAYARAQGAQTLHNVQLFHRSPHFGGLSGIEVYDNGTRAIALTDRGYLVYLDLNRENGGLQVKITKLTPLLAATGKPLRRQDNDAEGIVIDKQGAIYLSFEWNSRIARLNSDVTLSALPIPKGTEKLHSNSSYEALAITSDGALITMIENHQGEQQWIKRFDGTTWRDWVAIKQSGGFLPVGLDVAEDGTLYLLERKFKNLGFRNRIRAISIRGNTVVKDTEIFRSGWNQFGNLEGISVWTTQEGQTRLTLISDDNFRWPLQTRLIEIGL